MKQAMEEMSKEQLQKVNEEIEKELLEYIESGREETEEVKKQSNFSFFLTMVVIVLFMFFYQLAPIVIGLLKNAR